MAVAAEASGEGSDIHVMLRWWQAEGDLTRWLT
jgi:hypothetical protein